MNHKYIIQIYKLTVPGSPVGKWSNTAWGGNRAKEIGETKIRNKLLSRVRVVEVLSEWELPK